jgi:hypothetical protein
LNRFAISGGNYPSLRSGSVMILSKFFDGGFAAPGIPWLS